MTDILDFSTLYRLPFSKNDNFNGWLEITTCCNMTCPGCYRGCDAPNHQGETKTLNHICAEILELKKLRNCSMISISGGEPLLHPDLLEIITFIKSQHMNPVLFTNGVLLKEETLRSLVQAGLTGITIRVDALQHPEENRIKKQLYETRDKYIALCKTANIFLIFTACIDRSTLPHVPHLLEWAEHNAPHVGQLLLILKRQLAVSDQTPQKNEPPPLSLDEVLVALNRDRPKLSFAAYLGSQAENQSAKWLQAFQIVRNKTVLGCAGKKFPEILQMSHHFRNGTYLGITEKKKMKISFLQLLCLSIFDRKLRSCAIQFFLQMIQNPVTAFQKATVQPVTIVVPPHFVKGKRDLCDACPDAILYNGELVPSCALEEIRRFGKLYEKF